MDIIKEISFWVAIIAAVLFLLTAIPAISNKIGKKGDIVSRVIFIVICLICSILYRFF